MNRWRAAVIVILVVFGIAAIEAIVSGLWTVLVWDAAWTTVSIAALATLREALDPQW